MISRTVLKLAIEGWPGDSRDLYGPGHALLLHLLRAGDPVAAEALHDSNRRKPLALSPLAVESLGHGVARASLSVATWAGGIDALLGEALSRALDLSVSVHSARAILVSVEPSAPISPCDLFSLADSASQRVRFQSPTFFGLGRAPGGQRYGLLPDAALTVGSWLRPWIDAGGAFDGPAITGGWLADRVALRSVRSITTTTVHGLKTALTGFTGEATYAWVGPEPWGPSLLAALTRFAEYCGTGAKTGHGFGQTRRLAG